MIGAGFGIAAICLYLDLTRAALDLSLARLGLPTPHDRPLRKQAARGWSVTDTRRLILWRQTGIHPDVIGAGLDRTANAVRGKARRLGIPAPDRRTLRRVDPWSLPDPVPGFGFPDPASAALSEQAAHAQPSGETQPTHPQPGAAESIQPGRPTDDTPPAPVSTKPTRMAQVQPEPAPLPVVAAEQPVSAPAPLAAPEDVDASPVVEAAAPAGISAAAEPVGRVEVATTTDAKAPDLAAPFVTRRANAPTPPLLPAASRQPRVSRPGLATPDDDGLKWIGELPHVIYDKEAVRIIGMRQMGLEHWRSTAPVLGLTPGQLRTIRTRIDIPLDTDRGKFAATYDPDLAQLNFDTCGYTLMQERPNPDTGRPGHWFFRRNGSKDRLSLWTQRHVTKTIDKRTYDFSRVPVDLKTSVRSQKLLKGSLPFMQGSTDEKRACRGHAPPVRSGLPGRPGDEMPWTCPGAGSAARGVACP
jgi:hypothetical protein